MAAAALSPDLVERFRSDLHALMGGDGGRLGIAVSGGPDSLALLLLAQAARPGEVTAATVDHRLRPESAGEAAFVASICAELDVPHTTLAADAPIEGNVQSGARALRYRLLGDWAAGAGIDCLLTAHHRDDQAETLLMRLQRGAGVAGLAGIRAATRIGGLAVARPLLGWTRAELRAVVDAAGLAPVEDPSNSDERYDRARLRQYLAQADWIDTRGLARSAEALAEAEAALEWATERLYRERVETSGTAIQLDPAGLPDELRRRLVLRILAMLVTDAAPRGPDLQRLLAALDEGGTATLAGVKASGGATWRFVSAPPRRG
jgi:tRNA(Ile)-lysidine synthase